ncbi:MAG TPA: TonB-dependent receptor [Sphingomicrobium sp.]|nr:TonB-dependent receptor [Sphingomicrobium sp.]
MRSLRSRRALLLAGGCCSSLLAAALPSEASAQSTSDQTTATQPADTTAPGDVNAQPPADQGAIVVTGIRRSIQNSIQIKRRETSMVEAVSAEEIGKLPDVSIAESIARLPGLTAQRVAGRAQIVSIRGFSPDFSTVLLNGRQQASSGFNRAVEFDQYPSELLGSVVVYKTPDAGISGMGLAGTVDLRTIRPLEYGKRAIVINLRGEYDQGGGRNAEMSNKGWRGSVSYIGQNKEGTLGWMLGYAHLDAPGHINHAKDWYYENYGGNFGGGDENILAGQEVRAYTSRDIRDGITGTLEWKPSDAIHSVLDLYYSRFKQHTTMHGAEWFSDAWIGKPTTFSNIQVETRQGVPFAKSGHVDGADLVLRNDDNQRTDHLFSAGLNNEFRLADRTHLYADLSYSSNKRDETNIETYAGYGAGPVDQRPLDSYDFVTPGNDFPEYRNFGFDYADVNQVVLGDREPWGAWGHDGLKQSPHVKETLASGDLRLNQELGGGFLSSFDVGLDYTRRHKTKTVDEHNLMLRNFRQMVPVDPRFVNDPTSLDFAGDWKVIDIDILDALSTYYDTTPVTDTAHYDKSWSITEDIVTGFAKANINSGDLHGNVGVQVVRQRQESKGLRINGTGVTTVLEPVDVTRTYTDVLPTLNLFYDLDTKNRIRFAAAKVMARPRMDDMRANLVPGFDSGICNSGNCAPGAVVHPWSAGGGNPDLRPWRAKEVDIAYEWYGGKATYLSVNAFNFWLDNYIYNKSVPFDFSIFPLPPNAAQVLDPATCDPINETNPCTISSVGTLSMPSNGQGGWIRGIEVSGAVDFGMFAHFLDGFGAQFGVAHSKYKLKGEAASTVGALPGFSPWVYNITGYYEKNGFQARASYRYRSTFKGEVVSLFSNLGTPQILADRQLDAQIGYTFQPGSRMNGLGILLQVNNLLNSPYRTSLGSPAPQTLETYEEYGRQWFLGASYRF